CLVDLRAVMHALRIVAEHAGFERTVLPIVGLALEHEAVLIEIVPMPRARIVGAECADGEFEIARRPRLALAEGARVKGAAAMLETAHLRNVVVLRNSHDSRSNTDHRRAGMITEMFGLGSGIESSGSGPDAVRPAAEQSYVALQMRCHFTF